MDAVEPTNNHPEQELRDFVLWRKRIFGSKSTRGNEYGERMMTVVKTARKQKRDILSLLISATEAKRSAFPQQIPSLFAHCPGRQNRLDDASHRATSANRFALTTKTDGHALQRCHQGAPNAALHCLRSTTNR